MQISFITIKHGNELLDLLLNNQDYVTLNELQTTLGLSRRSIFYVIKQVNAELAEHHLEQITNISNTGYFLPSTAKQQLQAHYVSNTVAQEQLTKQQRCDLIIWLLINGQTLSLTQLSNRFTVSKHTIIADLNIVEQLLAEHSLAIEQTSAGKRLAGAEEDKRFWVLNALSISGSLLDSQIDPNPSQLIEINTALHQLENVTGRYFTEAGLATLDQFILWLLQRLKNKHWQLSDVQMRFGTPESLTMDWVAHFLTTHHIHNFSENDFLESVIKMPQFYEQNHTDGLSQRITPISQEIIDRFNTISGSTISTTKLEPTLSAHLSSAYYRAKFQMSYHHPQLNQITDNYQELFSFTRFAIKPFESFIGDSLSDDEIALITLYFGGELESIARQKAKQTDIMIICDDGVAEAYLLRQRLRQHYPEIDFPEPLNVAQFNGQSDLSHVKLVLSTINIRVPQPLRVVNISASLQESDWQLISSELAAANLLNQIPAHPVVDDLLTIISHSAKVTHPEQLRTDLTAYLESVDAQTTIDKTAIRLRALLPKTHIRLLNDVLNWQVGVQRSIAPLILDHTVEGFYPQQVIRLINTEGPATPIGKGVMLVHANSIENINKPGISLLVLRQPVIFDINGHAPTQPIRLIIGLATTDQSNHLAALAELTKMVQDPAWLKKVENASSVDDIYASLYN